MIGELSARSRSIGAMTRNERGTQWASSVTLHPKDTLQRVKLTQPMATRLQKIGRWMLKTTRINRIRVEAT